MSLASEIQSTRLAWYPSACTDFRPLLYLHPALQDRCEVPIPDVFLFSDIQDKVSDKWFSGTKVLHDDPRTKLTATSVELIEKLNLPARRELIHSSDIGALRNHVYKITVLIESKKLSPTKTTIYYAFCENTALAKYLIDIRAHVSHLIRVCYGNGCGGSAASGAWLINIINELRTECLVSDKPASWYYDPSNWRVADAFAVKFFRFIPSNSYSRLELMDSMTWNGLNGLCTYWYKVSQQITKEKTIVS